MGPLTIIPNSKLVAGSREQDGNNLNDGTLVEHLIREPLDRHLLGQNGIWTTLFEIQIRGHSTTTWTKIDIF